MKARRRHHQYRSYRLCISGRLAVRLEEFHFV